MSDKPITFTQAGEPANPSPDTTQGAVGQVEQKGVQYVTLDEARRIASDAAEEAFRKAQGLVDKSTRRLSSQAKQQVESLRSQIQRQRDLGVPVTPEQEEKLVQDRINHLILSDDGEPTEPAPTPGSTDQGSQNKPVDVRALEIMQRNGSVVYENDPEYNALDFTSEDAFLQSVDRASQAKRARLAGTGTHSAPTMVPTSAATIQGTPGTNLQAAYETELAKVPRGNVHQVTELKKKYRGMGLQVN